MEELTPKVIETMRYAARDLTGSKRRAFEARVSLDYLGGDARLTETVFGWSRHTVAKGIKEFNSGQVIPDASRASKPKTEDANPQLAQDIIELVEPDSQTDPKFQGLFKYTRLTAKAVREKLIEHKTTRPKNCLMRVPSATCSTGWATRCAASSRRSLKKSLRNRCYL